MCGIVITRIDIRDANTAYTDFSGSEPISLRIQVCMRWNPIKRCLQNKIPDFPGFYFFAAGNRRCTASGKSVLRAR